MMWAAWQQQEAHWRPASDYWYAHSTFSESSAILRVPHPRLEEQMADNILTNRYVDIPCPSGKHARSIVTFRNHSAAALFCIPCEHAWTESTDHPALRDLHLDIAPGE
jgi:hypothetical protein